MTTPYFNVLEITRPFGIEEAAIGFICELHDKTSPLPLDSLIPLNRVAHSIRSSEYVCDNFLFQWSNELEGKSIRVIGDVSNYHKASITFVPDSDIEVRVHYFESTTQDKKNITDRFAELCNEQGIKDVDEAYHKVERYLLEASTGDELFEKYMNNTEVKFTPLLTGFTYVGE